MARDPSDVANYQSRRFPDRLVVFRAAFWILSFTMWSVFLALCLSANTAFADFPRLTRAIAMNDYLPRLHSARTATAFSHGIYALTGLTAIILIMFGGVTDRLISLYAIGAFLAFTLSQAGMVMHWYKEGPEHKGRAWHMFVNGTGAVAAAYHPHRADRQVHLRRVGVTALLVPTLILLMVAIKQHYARVRDVVQMGPINLSNLLEPLSEGNPHTARWDRMTEKALPSGCCSRMRWGL